MRTTAARPLASPHRASARGEPAQDPDARAFAGNGRALVGDENELAGDEPACVGNKQADIEEERALVEAARSDRQSFGALYLRYLPRIYRYLRLRAGSDEDAADLSQEVFERALKAFPGYRDRGLPFGPWLFAIARNRSADAARRVRAAGSLVPLDVDVPGPDDPEAALVRREAAERVGRLVAALDSDKRELLALRFAAGLSSREIGQVVGRSEASVKQQLVRLLRALHAQSLEERTHDR